MRRLSQLLRSPLVRILPALLWMAIIFALSAQQTMPKTPGISIDMAAVVGHLVTYGILAILLLWALPAQAMRLRYRLVLAVLLAALYGASDEFHQSFVPGRNATMFDLIVDTVGAILAILLYAAWRLRIASRAR